MIHTFRWVERMQVSEGTGGEISTDEQGTKVAGFYPVAAAYDDGDDDYGYDDDDDDDD